MNWEKIKRKIKLTADAIPKDAAINSANFGKILKTNKINEKKIQNKASLICTRDFLIF
mgnify:CR=1 FL=1